jgi:pimeloyl-ACP methyl ester carboxylesterase
VVAKISLILLPGMLCDSASWKPQAEALADICQISVAVYGHLDTVAAMTHNVLLNAPPYFAVCGHSMGGRVAQEIYRTAPGRVIGLGLFGTDYRGLASDTEREREFEDRLADAQRAERIGMLSYAREWALRLLPPSRHSDRELVDSIAEMAARHSPAVIRAQGHAGAYRRDYGDLLAQIRCPTLICAGGLDTLRPIDPHEHMARAIPGARLVVIPAAGHMMAMEQPRDTSIAMREWIDTVHTSSRFTRRSSYARRPRQPRK